jgi:hypothetical protein
MRVKRARPYWEIVDFLDATNKRTGNPGEEGKVVSLRLRSNCDLRKLRVNWIEITGSPFNFK